jgi:serine/threonine protein kinase
MGVILYVLLAGFLPFEENTMIALFLKIKNADFTYPSWFSREVRTLLDKVLVSDPTKRLTLNELKHHQWLVEGAACPDAPGSVGHDDSHSNATEAVEASRKEVAAAHAKNPLPSHNRTPPASQPASPGKPAQSDVAPKTEHVNSSKTDTVKTSVQTASSTSQSSPAHSAGNDRPSSSPSPSPRLAESEKLALNTVHDGKAHTAHGAPSPSHSGKATAAAVHAPSVTAPTSTSTAAPEHTTAKSDMGGKHKGKEKDGAAMKPATQACCTIA